MVNLIKSIKRKIYICDAWHIMRTFNVIVLGLGVTIIALAGIAVVKAASLLLAQSASAFTDVMTNTTVGGEEESLNTTSMSSNNDNNNDNSNSILGKLFLTGEDRLTSFNRINQTYTEVSSVGNRTIMPLNPTNTTATAVIINATETGNLTLKLQPNGITFVEGQTFLVIEGEGGGGNNSGGAEQKENATAMLVGP